MSPREQAPSDGSVGATVLLVEDQAIIALAEASTLQRAGYKVVTVHTGEAAVSAVRDSEEIAVVLMDIDLGPGIDGTVAASHILAIRNIPIVFLTSHGEKAMVDKVKGITRYGYVLKNAGEFVLLESVAMALELFRAHQETAEREERIRRLSRTQAVLGEVNQAILRINDGASVYDAICRIAVETGEFLFAWIGVLDPAKQIIRSAAEYGDDRGLRKGMLVTVGRSSGGAGPTAVAFDSGSNVILNDLAAKEEGTSWERRAVAAGVYAVGSFPIRVFGEVEAVLTLYSEVASFFDEDEVSLLNSLSDDLGFGLEVDRREAAARMAEEQRRYWREMMRSVVENAPYSIALFDRELRYLYVSTRYLEVYRVTKEELLGKYHYDVFPEIPEKWRRAHRQALAGEVLRAEDDFVVRSDGRVEYNRWECRPWYNAGGGIGGMILYSELIDKEQATEAKARRLLEQQDLLVREAHHRIKNDMQNVRALLSLEAAESRDPGARSALAEAAGRIEIIAALYDAVYRKEEVNAPRDLLTTLDRLLRTLAARVSDPVPHIELEGDSLELPESAATPIGLIVNEAVTNSVKHADSRNNGEAPPLVIKVSVGKEPDGVARLTIRDNGAGFPEEILAGEGSGFGMTVIAAFAEQLGATVSRYNDGGAVIDFRFPTLADSEST